AGRLEGTYGPLTAWTSAAAPAAGADRPFVTACKPPRPGSRGASYSGQPATGVQLQVTADTTTAGVFGVMATNPRSRIGECGPENTSLTAPVTGPTVPS